MATKSFKTRFEFGDAETWQASAVWTAFAKVIEIAPPPIKAQETDTTHLESPDEFIEAEPTLGDAGESSFKIQFEAEQMEDVYGLFRQKHGFRIVYADLPYPSGSKLKFNGWISGVEGEPIQKDNTIEQTITVRVIGKPAFEKKAA